MVWDQLSINKPHLVYIILGGFTSIFMLVSLFIKEKMYIGEATVATICGVIFGPHAANLIDPLTWGNTDQITLEFSRIVLVVQCFAVGVELPKAYMERHWRSVVFLLVPVMTFGWLITSLFIWWLIDPLSWLESLCIAACVTATDPVLASSVVGKGKFAKRVPKHLRDLLSAESGCNDGMAFPFIYLSLYLIKYHLNAGEVTFHWICYTILYECIFGAVFGVCVGYIGRHAIKFAERKELIDRDSFLVFYFVLALFCAGAGSMLGMDDLLIGFAAGVGFSNDGWFTEKTEESHVSNVIDLLINLSYFVYFGTIIPWDQFNAPDHGLVPWRLVVIAILVIFFRRIPVMLALKPFIPDIKTWREALFAGHFGPIGVGAVFVAILARAELETGSTTPLDELPAPDTVDYNLIWCIWPITCFLIMASILVHGSSIAVFTLGKRINTLTITLSYTQDNDRSSAWMNRLPRIASTKSMSKMSDEFDSTEKLDVPPGQLPPIGIPKLALRRQKEDEYDEKGTKPPGMRPYRRRKRKDRDGMGPGGPISQSAIMPQRMSDQMLAQHETTSDSMINEKADLPSPNESNFSGQGLELRSSKTDETRRERRRRKEEGNEISTSPSDDSPAEVEAYEEGDELVIEDTEGTVLKTVNVKDMTKDEKTRIIEETRNKLTRDRSGTYAKHKHEPHKRDEEEEAIEEIKDDAAEAKETAEHPQKSLRKALDGWKGFGKRRGEDESRDNRPPERKRGPAHAYQFGNTIIVEDEDGEVIKTYTIPNAEGEGRRFTVTNEQMRHGLQRMGTWIGLGKQAENAASEASGIPVEKLRQHEDDPVKDGAQDEKSTSASKTKPKAKGAGLEEAISLDDGLRLTISKADMYGLTGLQKRKQFEGKESESIGMGSGRRMSTKDFIMQMQRLDPKAKVDAVEQSDASEDIKRDVRSAARKEAAASRPGARRSETTPGKAATVRRDRDISGSEDEDEHGVRRPEPARSQSDMPNRNRPRAKRTNTSESMDNIVEEDEIPTHDLRSTVARRGQTMTAAELRRKRLAAGKGDEKITELDEDADETDGETPAERRRRLAALGASSGDDDEKETPAERRRRLAALGTRDGDDEEGETAAEKRRRLAALGIADEDSSDSDEMGDSAPRRPPKMAVQEPDRDQPLAKPAPKPRIQWGGETREADNRDSDSDIGETKGQKMGRKFKNFLAR